MQQLWLRYYFKFVVPKIQFVTHDGIRLDVRAFSPKIRNRILMGYEEAEKRLCSELFGPEDSILEIGGGIGFIGLFCQKKLGVKNYFTAEANPQTIEVLKRNYDLNGVMPRVRNVALGKENGTVALNVSGDFWEHSVTNRGKRQSGETISVPATSLSGLIEMSGPVNALIIDVEGAESLIDFSQLPEAINKILIELHPHVIGRKKTSEILAAFRQMQFQTVGEQDNSFAFFRNAAKSQGD